MGQSTFHPRNVAYAKEKEEKKEKEKEVTTTKTEDSSKLHEGNRTLR